jgi:hypothetical protein
MRNHLKLDHPGELSLALERAGEPPSRRDVARSVQDRCDVLEFAKCEVGRDAYPASDHTRAGIGSVVVAGIWLAFCVTAAVHPCAFGN